MAKSSRRFPVSQKRVCVFVYVCMCERLCACMRDVCVCVEHCGVKISSVKRHTLQRGGRAGGRVAVVFWQAVQKRTSALSDPTDWVHARLANLSLLPPVIYFPSLSLSPSLSSLSLLLCLAPPLPLPVLSGSVEQRNRGWLAVLQIWVPKHLVVFTTLRTLLTLSHPSVIWEQHSRSPIA